MPTHGNDVVYRGRVECVGACRHLKRFCDCPDGEFGYSPSVSQLEGNAMISTLKGQTLETESLIEKIRAEIKKRAEAKAKRALLKRPKRLAKR